MENAFYDRFRQVNASFVLRYARNSQSLAEWDMVGDLKGIVRKQFRISKVGKIPIRLVTIN